MNYKISLSRVLKTFRIGLNGTIISWGLIICALLIKYRVIPSHTDPARADVGTLAVVLGTAMMWVPAFLCLLQYIYYSIGIELRFNENNGTLTIKTNKEEVNLTEDEIIDIEMICSRAIAEKRTNIASTDPFYYYRININKTFFIIPCVIIGAEMKDFYTQKIKITPKYAAFIF